MTTPQQNCEHETQTYHVIWLGDTPYGLCHQCWHALVGQVMITVFAETLEATQYVPMSFVNALQEIVGQ